MENKQLATFIKDGKTYANISDLTEWDKNPRGIKTEDFQRLLKQLEKLGQYKPLLVIRTGMVLGGNMRLKGYRKLGITEIWVSVVDPKNEGEMLKYALSDNDRVGYYEEDALAELVLSVEDQEDLDVYRVDLGEASTLADVLAKFAPVDGEEQPSLDQKEHKVLICPSCGHEGPVKTFVEKEAEKEDGTETGLV